MFDLATFLQSIGPAMSIAKGITNLDEKQRVLEALIQSQLLVAENSELRSKVNTLEAQLQFQATLRFDRNVYTSSDASDPGPYCPACWDDKRKAVHLINSSNFPSDFKCPICTKHFDMRMNTLALRSALITGDGGPQ